MMVTCIQVGPKRNVSVQKLVEKKKVDMHTKTLINVIRLNPTSKMVILIKDTMETMCIVVLIMIMTI